MFAKNSFVKKNQVLLKSKAVKDLKRNFVSFLIDNDKQFLELNDFASGEAASTDLAAILLPKESRIGSFAITQSDNKHADCVLIESDGVPCLVTLNLPCLKENFILPTLNFLQSCSKNLLPTILVFEDTFQFLENGANLFVKGIRNWNDIVPFKKHTVFQVCALEHVASPRAIVVALEDSDDPQCVKLKTLLVQNDFIWRQVPEKPLLQPTLAPASESLADSAVPNVEITPEQMEEHCRWSLLQALSTRFDNSVAQFPIPLSQFFDLHMQSCRPIPEKLNLKLATSKTVSKFLEPYFESGLLKKKIRNKETLVASFDSQSPELAGFSAVSKSRLQKLQGIEAECNDTELQPQALSIENMYRPKSKHFEFLLPFMSSQLLDDPVTESQVRDGFCAFLAAEKDRLGACFESDSPTRINLSRLFVLVPSLKHLLGEYAQASLTATDIVQALLRKMQPCYRLTTREDGNLNNGKIVNKKHEPIIITVSRSGGNKFKTKVQNWSDYYRDASLVSKELQTRFATSVSEDSDGKLCIMGDHSYALFEYFTKSLGIAVPKGFAVPTSDQKKKSQRNRVKIPQTGFITVSFVKI